MSTSDNTTPNSGHTDPSRPDRHDHGHPHRHRHGRKLFKVLLFLVALTAVISVGVGIGTKVFAGPGGWHSRGAWGDPARVEQNVERMVKHFAVEIDATADQQAKLTTLAKAAAKDMQPMREKLIETRREAVAALSAPTIDRVAVERIRATQMEAMQVASTRLSQLLADAAEVLTPAQRKELATRMAEWQERRHR